MRILVLNGGSSSLKCRLDDFSELPIDPPIAVWEKHADVKDHSQIADVLKSVPGRVDVVGHRIVHGGPNYRQPTLLIPEVRHVIQREAEMAPAHNRFELAAIQTVDRVLGAGIVQIAVFDTGFHTTLEPAAYVYPGPYEWLDQGIRRYGFHGISCQYAARRAAQILGESLRLIVCHLGSGASVSAVRDGKSVDTSMGFTPLEGLMMATRSGSIDPGIIIYLLRHRGYTAEQLDRILNQESGLRGVSGVSGDMREILSSVAAGNKRAQLAFDIYVHRLCREIGGMLAVLGGADALIFTGGVGENCAPVREAVAAKFGFLALKTLVIHAEEEWEISRECFSLMQASR